MHFHYQNLNDSDKPLAGGILRNGRAWWGNFRWEWTFLTSPRLGFAFAKGDSHWLLTFQFILGQFFFGWNDSGDSDRTREFSIRWDSDGWTTWLHIWTDPWESRRDDPWWKQSHKLSILDTLFGRRDCEHKEFGEVHTVMIPMPEGKYPALMRRENRTWTRKRWKHWPFRLSRDSMDIKIPRNPV